MSHLSEEIERQMKQASLTQADIERADPFLDQSFVSRLVTGKQATVSMEQLQHLARALSKERRDHADLYIAHLRDVLPEADLVAISSMALSDLKEKGKRQRSEFEEALSFLSVEARRNSHLKALLIRLHKMMLEEGAE